MTGTPEFGGREFTFVDAERGLGFQTGTLRMVADNAGWTNMHMLNACTLCDVLSLIYGPEPVE